MHALFCACSFVLVYFLYPETANIPLEEMSDVFGDSDPTPEEEERMSISKLNRVTRQSSISLPSLASFTEYDQMQRRKRSTNFNDVKNLTLMDKFKKLFNFKNSYQNLNQNEQ